MFSQLNPRLGSSFQFTRFWNFRRSFPQPFSIEFTVHFKVFLTNKDRCILENNKTCAVIYLDVFGRILIEGKTWENLTLKTTRRINNWSFDNTKQAVTTTNGEVFSWRSLNCNNRQSAIQILISGWTVRCFHNFICYTSHTNCTCTETQTCRHSFESVLPGQFLIKWQVLIKPILAWVIIWLQSQIALLCLISWMFRDDLKLWIFTRNRSWTPECFVPEV